MASFGKMGQRKKKGLLHNISQNYLQKTGHSRPLRMFTVLPAQAKITGVVEMSDVEDLLATGQGPYAPPAISGTCPLPHAGASSCKACVNNLVCRHKLGDIIPAADGEIPDAVPADAEIEKALTIESPDPAGAVPKEGRWAGPFPLGEAEFERLLALESGLDPEMETRQLSKGVSVSKKKALL